jgi:hypothetical protein
LRETTKRNEESPNLRRLILHLLAILLLVIIQQQLRVLILLLLFLDLEEPVLHNLVGAFLQ